MKLVPLLLLLSTPIFAQPGGPLVFVTSDPAGACAASASLQFNTTNGKLWGCNAGTWATIGGGGGGSASIGGAVTGGTDCAVLFVDPAAILAQDAANYCYLKNALVQTPDPTLTTGGTAGMTTYGYELQALGLIGHSDASNEITIATGNASLDMTNLINVATHCGGLPAGTLIQVSRTTSMGMPSDTGPIGSPVACGATLQDTGLISSPPFTFGPIPGNTSAGLYIANSLLVGKVLEVGIPDLNFSCCDGASNSVTQIQNNNIQDNFAVFSSSAGNYIEETFYRARGTSASPSNVANGDIVLYYDYFAWVGGLWTFTGWYNSTVGSDGNGKQSIRAATLTTGTDGFFEFKANAEFSVSSASGNTGGPTNSAGLGWVSSGIGEINNGTNTSAGGALIQLNVLDELITNQKAPSGQHCTLQIDDTGKITKTAVCA